MNLRIIPAVQSSPTVIFSLSWHNLPASIPLPSYFSSQLAACQDANIPAPRNTLAMDKAVGFHLLLDSVTFDLARKVVIVAWLDHRSHEWSIDEVSGLGKALEEVLDCVKQSGEEAAKEKAAAALANAAKAAPAPPQSMSVASSGPDSSSSQASTSASASKRHRTASGIFSSLVASFITQPDQARSRRAGKSVSGSPIVHKHHIFHPINKRETLPANNVPQSRFLRRQARAKLVDIFRYYVASRITSEMRVNGIVGEELKRRGILDDIDVDDEEEHGATPGLSGYASAGGYVAHMARSMLRTAFAEAKADDNDSWSSSSEDSLLLTPKNSSNTSLPSETSDKASRPSSPAPRSSTPSAPRRRATTPSPQARQIRHLSSVLIGLTQKDKRAAADEREMLELVKERSLRRRWSSCEARPPPGWTKPCISSPLRSFQVAEYEDDSDDEIIVVRGSSTEQSDVPFPADAAAPVPFPSAVPSTPRRTQSLPSPPPTPIDEDAFEKKDEDAMASLPPKAAEAEDILPSPASSRSRRSSLLATPPANPPPSPITPNSSNAAFPSRPPLAPIQTRDPEDADLMVNLPSPKYTEEDEKRFQRSVMRVPRDVDSDSDEGDDKLEVSPPPQYAVVPSDVSLPSHCFRDIDIKKTGEVRGLELDTSDSQEALSPSYWPRSPDGIIVA